MSLDRVGNGPIASTLKDKLEELANFDLEVDPEREKDYATFISRKARANMPEIATNQEDSDLSGDDDEDMDSNGEDIDNTTQPEPSKDTNPPPHSPPALEHAHDSSDEEAVDHARLARDYTADIEPSVAKTRNLKDFIASLFISSSKPNKKPKEFKAPPIPHIPHLRSFVNHKQVHVPGDSDSDDLEIVPESWAQKLNPAERRMLQLSGHTKNTESERSYQIERQKLANLEHEQIKQKQAQRLEILNAQGIDVNQINNQIQNQRAKLLGKNMLEIEAEEADKLRESSGSDSEGGEGNYDLSEEDNVEAVSRPPRMFDDSEDEEQDTTKPTDALTATQTQEMGPLPAGHTGTQYIAPNPAGLADLLGLSSDGDEDEESLADQPSSHHPAPAPVQTGASNATPQDTPQDTMPDTLENDGAPNILDDMDSQPALVEVEPDLSDLANSKMSSEERMAEVKRRYEKAQQENRKNQETLKKSQQPTHSNQHLKQFLDSEAEESDGEGQVVTHNDKEDFEQDRELTEIIDNNTRVSSKENERLRAKFAEEERIKEQRALDLLARGVHGGFRNKNLMNTNGRFLGFEENEEVMERREKLLLQASHGAAKIAAKGKASSFFASVTESMVARRPKPTPTNTEQSAAEFLRGIEKRNQLGAHGYDNLDSDPIEVSPLKKPHKAAFQLVDDSEDEKDDQGSQNINENDTSQALKAQRQATKLDSQQILAKVRRSTQREPTYTHPSKQKGTLAQRIAQASSREGLDISESFKSGSRVRKSAKPIEAQNEHSKRTNRSDTFKAPSKKKFKFKNWD